MEYSCRSCKLHEGYSSNYQKQIEEARKFVEENGYVESFDRRMATISDIRASEILHIAAESKIKATSMFDGVKSTSTRHKRSEFKDIEINIDKFMKDILPSCTSVEVFFRITMNVIWLHLPQQM